jgi:FAD:protein FMN transferase
VSGFPESASPAVTTLAPSARRVGGRLALLAGTLVVLALSASGRAARGVERAGGEAEAEVVEVHFAMATPVRIAARGVGETAVRRAVRSAFAEIRRLEDILSTFDPASDASRLNRSAGDGGVSVAPELADLLVRSGALSARTGGTFSVLVGPLVETWRMALSAGRPPDPRAIERARALARSELVTVTGRRVSLAERGMRIDLGGIAKGFAADRALEVLRESGTSAAIVDLGGSSIAAFGDAGDGRRGWPVALPAAARADDERVPVLWLRDAALSTSATRGRELVPGAHRGHIVDPRSGRLLDVDAVAFVRHASATDAEALSKALVVLGSDAAPILGASSAEAAVVYYPGARALCTPGFRSLVAGCTVLSPRRAIAPGSRSRS